jgi:hypothetical protein
MLPVMLALTSSAFPLCSASSAMISSAALPKVALSSPPMPGPGRLVSVASPCSRSGSTPRQAVKNTQTAGAHHVLGDAADCEQRMATREPPAGGPAAWATLGGFAAGPWAARRHASRSRDGVAVGSWSSARRAAVPASAGSAPSRPRLEQRGGEEVPHSPWCRPARGAGAVSISRVAERRVILAGRASPKPAVPAESRATDSASIPGESARYAGPPRAATPAGCAQRHRVVPQPPGFVGRPWARWALSSAVRTRAKLMQARRGLASSAT